MQFAVAYSSPTHTEGWFRFTGLSTARSTSPFKHSSPKEQIATEKCGGRVQKRLIKKGKKINQFRKEAAFEHCPYSRRGGLCVNGSGCHVRNTYTHTHTYQPYREPDVGCCWLTGRGAAGGGGGGESVGKVATSRLVLLVTLRLTAREEVTKSKLCSRLLGLRKQIKLQLCHYRNSPKG